MKKTIMLLVVALVVALSLISGAAAKGGKVLSPSPTPYVVCDNDCGQGGGVDQTCTDFNQGQVVWYNGVAYVCTGYPNDYWRPLW